MNEPKLNPNRLYQLPFYQTNEVVIANTNQEIIRTYQEFEFNSNGVKKKVAPDAIKDREHLEQVKDYFLSQGKYRDYAIFVFGINTALRCSDILALNISNVLTEDGVIADRLKVIEKKTARFGRTKEVILNQATKEALYLYLTYLGNENIYYLEPNQPLFRSNKISSKTHEYRLGRPAYYEILRSAANAVNLTEHIGTHSMRKTFGYNCFTTTQSLELTSKAIGHKSAATTLDYIGITNQDISNVILNLNL